MANPANAGMGQITYHEPTLPQLLTLLGLFYLLQVARELADRVLGAGLLGESKLKVGVGVVFGPVAEILLPDWETTIVAIGYIGLVIIVFEGGLHISPRHFIPSLPLATFSALVGILLPMACTFGLFSAFGFPTLHAFSAGSALASTSLGTTFSILRTVGKKEGYDLAGSRVGAILQGAALIDDVIALVLLSVISSLGEEGGAGLGWTIGRPILASIAVAGVLPLLALGPGRWVWRRGGLETLVARGGPRAELLVGAVVLSGSLAICYYAGTTMLLGAFLAGVILHLLPRLDSPVSFSRTYHTHIEVLQLYIFCPLFFASIGLTVPFLSLWTGTVVWRGIVYAILMTLGKVLVGAVILGVDAVAAPAVAVDVAASSKRNVTSTPLSTAAERRLEDERPEDMLVPSTRRAMFVKESLPAAGFLGVALVARGEIGVLVLQVAYNSSSSPQASESRVLGTEAYLIALWAVALCTIVGPIAFSSLADKFGAGIYRGRWGAQTARE